MIKYLISDLSRTLLFPSDSTYSGSLNSLHKINLSTGDYNFWEYFVLNQELLEFYKSLKNKIQLVIFTTDAIQSYPPLKTELEKVFDTLISANDFLHTKEEPEAYLELLEIIKSAPQEIVYIDDLESNIKAASDSKINTIWHQNNPETIRQIMHLVTLT